MEVTDHFFTLRTENDAAITKKVWKGSLWVKMCAKDTCIKDTSPWYTKSLLQLCKRSYQTFIKRWFPHAQIVCLCPVKQKPSAVNQSPPVVLHLSSYYGTWNLINNFQWNVFLQNLFNLHSFCCIYCISVPYLVTEITKTVNKLLYGRILFEQAQYDVKAQPVSPLWLYKTYLFPKVWHLAVNCTGYLQDGSRIGWFTLSLVAIHCAGHCNVRKAFFLPRSWEIWEM